MAFSAKDLQGTARILKGHGIDYELRKLDRLIARKRAAASETRRADASASADSQELVA